MKPAAFALLVLVALLVGGTLGGAVGYRIPERSPMADPNAGGAARLLGALAGESAVNEAYEADRRRWGGGGIVAGALIGLLSAGLVGGYSLRYGSRAPARNEEGGAR